MRLLALAAAATTLCWLSCGLATPGEEPSPEEQCEVLEAQVTALTPNPQCLPDPTEPIAIEVNEPGNKSIYVMKADGTGITDLTPQTTSDGYPAISPDGFRIAFESFRSGLLGIPILRSPQ